MLSTETFGNLILSFNSMSQKRLQRLAYFTYVWYLAMQKEKMKAEEERAYKKAVDVLNVPIERLMEDNNIKDKYKLDNNMKTTKDSIHDNVVREYEKDYF